MSETTRVVVSTTFAPATTGNSPHGASRQPGTLFIGTAEHWKRAAETQQPERANAPHGVGTAPAPSRG